MAPNTRNKLKRITLLRDRVQDWEVYPFNIGVIRTLDFLELTSRMCFFVGENGSGKWTLLEAIAEHCGFGREGGSKNIRYETAGDKNLSVQPLSRALPLSWSTKILNGYFFRAESFFNIATYFDQNPDLWGDVGAAYGGKSLHDQSHGQSLMALFENRFFRKGFYLLDEPEAALSPQRQLSFLLVLHDLLRANEEIQFIIATHSPILLAYPGSQIVSFDGDCIREIAYKETPAYQIVSGFLKEPETYLRHLFSELPFDRNSES